jgi:hypothetical protein
MAGDRASAPCPQPRGLVPVFQPHEKKKPFLVNGLKDFLALRIKNVRM